jgi:hypothetical protein
VRFASLLLLAAALAAQDGPRIVFNKSFPQSSLPFVSITVEKSGKTVYKEAPDDPQPINLQLTETETTSIFELADKLDRFNRKLESGLKVANMGIKTFRYEAGGQNHEVKFNYTQDTDAQLLNDWFERIAETVQHSINLEKTARFDRLGVDRALINLQVSVERNRLAGADVLLPMLDRVAKGSAYMNRARERAASIAEYIRSGKQKSE